MYLYLLCRKKIEFNNVKPEDEELEFKRKEITEKEKLERKEESKSRFAVIKMRNFFQFRGLGISTSYLLKG